MSSARWYLAARLCLPPPPPPAVALAHFLHPKHADLARAQQPILPRPGGSRLAKVYIQLAYLWVLAQFRFLGNSRGDRQINMASLLEIRPRVQKSASSVSHLPEPFVLNFMCPQRGLFAPGRPSNLWWYHIVPFDLVSPCNLDVLVSREELHCSRKVPRCPRRQRPPD